MTFFRTLNQLVCVERCTNRAAVYLFVWLSPLLQSQLCYDKRIFFFRQKGCVQKANTSIEMCLVVMSIAGILFVILPFPVVQGL